MHGYTSAVLKRKIVRGAVRCNSNPVGLRRPRLQARSPETYRVRVATHSSTNDFALEDGGRVTVHVPPMGPGCSSHLFGVIQVYDESPFAWRVVHEIGRA